MPSSNQRKSGSIRWRSVGGAIGFSIIAFVPWPQSCNAYLNYHGDPTFPLRGSLFLIGIFLIFLGFFHNAFTDTIRRIEHRLPSIAILAISLLLITLAAIPRLYCPIEHVKLGAPDTIEYALAAQNLVDRGHYAITLNGIDHPPRYPFGFSAFLITPILAFFKDDPRYAVYASFLCGLAVLILSWSIARRFFGEWTAGGCVGVLLMFPPVLKYSREVFSDMAVTMFFLILVFVIFLWTTCPKGLPGKRLSVFLGLTIAVGTSIKLSLALLLLIPIVLSTILSFTRPAPERVAIHTYWSQRVLLSPASLVLYSFVIGILPLLLFNFQQFGSPLRTGYHYWCSIPYDYPRLTFSLRYLWHSYQRPDYGNLLCYLFPPIQHPWKHTGLLLQSVYWFSVVAGIRLIYQTSLDDNSDAACTATKRSYCLTLVSASSIFLVFYSCYFFHDTRFLLPVYIGLLPVSIWYFQIITRISPMFAANRIVGMGILLLTCITMWTLGPKWSRPSDQYPRALASARIEMIQAANKLLPENAPVISNLDGAFLEYFLLRGTHRRYLPIDRNTEYASKFAQLRPNGTWWSRWVEPPTTDPFKHRGIALTGSSEVYPQTAVELAAPSHSKLDKEKIYYLLLEHPVDAVSLRALSDIFHRELLIEDYSRNLWSVWRLRPRQN